MAGTSRLNSVINRMPFLRTGDPAVNVARAVTLAGVLGTAREAATRYREVVARHDDLARRVCQLLGYVDISHWNGYVPSRLMTSPDPAPSKGDTLSDSPYRAALVAIVTEALDRDGEWRHHDADRLAPVPSKALRAPWSEAPRSRGEG